MKLNEALDLAIRNLKQGKGGYVINGKKYENYMSNDVWNTYLENMRKENPVAYKKYSKEICGKSRPPKMASFGSSSQMIYELSKEITNFEFETQYNTYVGGKSNLDGTLLSKYCTVCVEAKCREPYGSSHMGEKRKNNYKELLNYISKQNIGLKFICNDEVNSKISINSYSNDRVIEHFDIIQLICHYCGIANQIIRGKINTPVKFVYLIYNPKCISQECFVSNTQGAILQRYSDTIDEMKGIDMKKLFDVIFGYFSKAVGDYGFEFYPCDQKTYKEFMNNLR